MAALRRGGRLPQASVDPAARRATRDRRRRRLPLARKRAELLAHVHHPNSPDHLPASGTKMASKANRAGVAERLAAPAVHQRIAVDLARISDDDERRGDVERTRLKTATHHDAHTRSLRHTGPGIGTILRLVWRSASQAINRVPTVHDVVSSGRLGTCAQASAGTRLGTSGTQIGNAHLPWAFAEAAVWCRRDHPPAQTDLARVENTHDQGHALTVLAQQWARAVDDRLKRHVVFDRDQVFQRAWRRAEAPGAELDTQGMHLPDALDTAAAMASWNAQAPIGRETLSPAL